MVSSKNVKVSQKRCLGTSIESFMVSSPSEQIIMKRTCEAHPMGENSSFIFTVCVKSVPLYHFKLAYLVLHMAVKEFFGTHF